MNKIENWATSNGFNFSKSKTKCVHFCQLRKQHDDLVLHLYGSPIPVVEESKFLGILFDRKLSFIPHIKYLKAKCLKALNLLKVLSETSWGADPTTLLKLYRSLVRSNLDYGCIIYGSARKSYLQMGAQWLSGRVLDSRPKGRGFEPHRRHCVVSLSMTHLS